MEIECQGLWRSHIVNRKQIGIEKRTKNEGEGRRKEKEKKRVKT